MVWNFSNYTPPTHPSTPPEAAIHYLLTYLLTYHALLTVAVGKAGVCLWMFDLTHLVLPVTPLRFKWYCMYPWKESAHHHHNTLYPVPYKGNLFVIMSDHLLHPFLQQFCIEETFFFSYLITMGKKPMLH